VASIVHRQAGHRSQLHEGFDHFPLRIETEILERFNVWL
jgi:hypothetical protein